MKSIADQWEKLARNDPLWSILTNVDKQGRAWKIQDFLRTGQRRIDALLEALNTRGFTPERGAALDFGCGVGRLSQALAAHMQTVVGIDISPTMIRLGRELNFNGDRVRFLLNQRDDLEVVGDARFDLIVSLITLQHLPPEITRRYLAEFMRVLKPGGLLVFQLPSGRREGAVEGTVLTPMPGGAYSARIQLLDAPAAVQPREEAPIRVRVRNTSGIVWEPDDVAKLGIEVRWPAHDGALKVSKLSEIAVGNRWISAYGSVVQRDGREALGLPLAPGEETEVTLAVKPPPRRGLYTCEFDLVHEGITWFKDRGSSTARFKVTVGRPPLVRRAAALFSPLAARFRAWKNSEARATRALARKLDRAGVVAKWQTLVDDLPEFVPVTQPFDHFGIPRDEILALLERHQGGDVCVREDFTRHLAWESQTYFVRKVDARVNRRAPSPLPPTQKPPSPAGQARHGRGFRSSGG